MSSSVIEVEVEPSVLAVGPYHLVCAMNNRAWLYDLSRDAEPSLMSCREYIGTVSAVCLNAEYTATLLGTRVHLHYVSVPQRCSIGKFRTFNIYVPLKAVNCIVLYVYNRGIKYKPPIYYKPVFRSIFKE